VVEDETDGTPLYARGSCGNYGYQVLEATSGLEALMLGATATGRPAPEPTSSCRG
jgi:hypothetical protein